MKKDPPIPAQELPIIDRDPLPGMTRTSQISRCLFLGYPEGPNSFPDLLYFGADLARGKEIADQAGASGKYTLVKGLRNFEGGGIYGRQFEKHAAVEPQLAGKA